MCSSFFFPLPSTHLFPHFSSLSPYHVCLLASSGSSGLNVIRVSFAGVCLLAFLTCLTPLPPPLPPRKARPCQSPHHCRAGCAQSKRTRSQAASISKAAGKDLGKCQCGTLLLLFQPILRPLFFSTIILQSDSHLPSRHPACRPLCFFSNHLVAGQDWDL